MEMYEKREIQLDMCSCQFSLHYAFGTEKQAKTMLRNACESLKPGGFFIGTLPFAERIFSCLDPTIGRYSNSVLSVEYSDRHSLISNEKPPLFGAKLQFTLDQVVDCPEFLVHFQLLEKMLLEFDMELVYRKPFPDAFDFFMQNFKDARGLLGRMQALEPYPPEIDTEQIVDSTEYEWVEKKYNELERDRSITEKMQKMVRL